MQFSTSQPPTQSDQKLLPCHFYHSSVCNFKPCPYSHEGQPAGYCINETCALCFKQISHFTSHPSSFNNLFINNLQNNGGLSQSNRVHLPPSDYLSFMLPYRRPKQISKIVPSIISTDPQFVCNPSFMGRKRSESPQRKSGPSKKELDQRKVQSEDDQWICIGCGYEQNSYTIHECRQCQLPKINRRLDFSIDPNFDHELDFIFVIDFECTCTQDNSLELMEIIEFPIIVIDVKKRSIANTFTSFVKPTVNPILSEFCTKLTGITQEQVDRANPIDKVLRAADYFLQPYLSYNVAVLNDCQSDMKQFLFRESQAKKLEIPEYMKRFINLKKIFPDLTNPSSPITLFNNAFNERAPRFLETTQNIKIKGLDSMLAALNMQFIGRKHSGIADTKNIARVVIELLTRGYKFTTRLTESIYPYRMTLGDQNYKYIFILSMQFKTKNPQKIKEVGGVIVNLHKNQVIWSNIFHYTLKKELSEAKQYEDLLSQMKKDIILPTELKNQEFLIGTMGRRQMDVLKYELTKNKIEIPNFLSKCINLKKEIPELRKLKEKKSVNSNAFLIEEAMKILEIPQQTKVEQSSNSLMDAMNISQIVRNLVIKGHIFAEDSNNKI